MSGFAGIVHADGAPVAKELLDKIAKALEFRGPDVTSVCAQASAGFAFTLMRTGPAPQSRAQPCTIDGNVFLLGDIRLDGRDELAETLRANGEGPGTGATDEELVLHAWRIWGEQAPARVLGDFAFVIWERSSQRLFCFRDVIGVRPFFYAQAGKTLAFSNTLDVLRMVPGLDLSLDDAWVGDFLLQGFSSYEERTVYRGVKRLPAGHALRFESGQAVVARYTSLPIDEPVFYRDPRQYVERFRELLTQAVRERLPDGTVASFMSGGLDSTSVTAIAAQLLSSEARHRLRAFTMEMHSVFPDAEPEFAAQVAEYLGVPMQLIPLGDEPPFGSWALPALRTPEPSDEPFLFGNTEMYREVARFSRVVLCGDGGDDILTGKVVPYARYAWRSGRTLPVFTALIQFVVKARRWPTLGTGLRGKWRHWRSPHAPAELPDWIRLEFARSEQLQDRLSKLEQDGSSPHPFHPRGYRSLNGSYWASVMEQEDASAIGAPLERRAPYLSRQLVEFLLRVPPVPWCMEKELLRRAMHGVLPEAVRTRPKTPLPQDPALCQVERFRWRPKTIAEPHPEVLNYVDWCKWEATRQRVQGSYLLDAVRPLSLSYWLKAVENTRVFG